MFERVGDTYSLRLFFVFVDDGGERSKTNAGFACLDSLCSVFHTVLRLSSSQTAQPAKASRRC